MNSPTKKPILIAFPSKAYGGCEEYALTIAKALHEQGHPVHTLFPHHPETAVLHQAFSEIESSYTPLKLHYWLPGKFRRTRFVCDILRIVVVLLLKKPQAVHISLPWPDTATELLLACALVRIKTVVVFQLAGSEFQLSPKLKRWYLWAKDREQHWVAVSENNRKVLCNVFGLSGQEFKLIYNGVVFPKTFAPNSLPKVSEHNRLILTVGRLSRQKGQDLILRAFAQIHASFPQHSLVFLGEGELMDELKDLANQLNIKDKVLFLGRRSDVPQWLQRADIFVLPSRWEGQSFALLEAMAAGIPIIASNASSIPELIKNGQEGLLFEQSDIPDLTQKLTWALSNPREMKAMAGKANKKARGYDRQVMIADVLQLLDVPYRSNSQK